VTAGQAAMRIATTLLLLHLLHLRLKCGHILEIDQIDIKH
jgi:hypothetical protein